VTGYVNNMEPSDLQYSYYDTLLIDGHVDLSLQ
jgi:hypothetical protein